MSIDRVQPPVLRIDEKLQHKAAKRLRSLRARRNEAQATEALDTVEQAARGDTNLVPPILDAVESCATLGEITDRMRRVFGTWGQRG